MPTVVLVGTLDTKAREYDFVRSRLIEEGVTPLLVDFGVLADPPLKPDISSREVARAAGVELEDLRFGREGTDTRAVALKTMEQGLISIVRGLRKSNRCDGVLGMAGSGGSGAISGAMRSLPLGVPKLLVSTMASGDVAQFVGTRDICIMHSVTDIAGLNRVSRTILANAARAMSGMVKSEAMPDSATSPARPLIAVTMFGITTPGVLRILENLEQHGFETIVFHAVGSGGRAMEELIEEGVIDGVIDYTVSELTDHLLGGIFDAGPDRLSAAATRGIPQVVVPGAIEVLNFGPRDSVPPHFDRPDRPLVIHNDSVCAVRINATESLQLGTMLASKINVARGPVSVVLPLRGLDKYEAEPDGPFVDRAADNVLFSAIKDHLRPDISCTEIDANINDHGFADEVSRIFLRQWEAVRADES